MKFKETVSEVMLDEIASMNGFPFIILINDLWNSNNVDCIIGTSISFIYSKLLKIYLASIAQKHTLGHSTASVSSNIKATLARECPDVNIVENIWSVVSDTTVLARNIADHLNYTSQNDCGMHGGSMGFKYALGTLENTTAVDGIKIIPTPGSYDLPYVDAKIIIKGMRKIVDVFERAREEAVLIHTTQCIITFNICPNWMVTLEFHNVTLLSRICYSVIHCWTTSLNTQKQAQIR